MMVFMFPETRYKRKTISAATSSIGRTSPPARIDEAEKTKSSTDDEKASPSVANQRDSGDHVHPFSERPIGRPSRAQFALFSKPYFEEGLVFRDILAPVQVFSFPIICWAAFSLNFAANCLLALNLTQSQVFAAPPYLFNPAQVGFVNFAFVVGGVIGLLTAGPFSDWVAQGATARNKGIREAEMRLISLVPYICICLVGMTVVGVGYQRHWPWQAIVVVGYGFVGIEVVSIPAILIAVSLKTPVVSGNFTNNLPVCH